MNTEASTNPSSNRHDVASRWFLLSGLSLLLLASTLKIIESLKLAFPRFLDATGLWSYGRLRPIATGALIFGALTLLNLAAITYIIPRLTGGRLSAERLVRYTAPLLGGLVVVGIALIGWNGGDGHQLFDFALWVDLSLSIVLTGITVAVWWTIRQSHPQSLYVSTWYFVGGLLWIAILPVLGNLPGFQGAGTALQGAFASSGLVHVWLMGSGIGIAYYLVPKLAGRPLFSRQLARIGFWTLMFAGAASGYSRSVFGPAPDWTETVSAAAGLALLVAALSVAVNVVATMSGGWDRASDSVALKFALFGVGGVVLATLPAALQGFRSVGGVVSLTSWHDGILVMALGAALLLVAAAVYHMVPNLFGRDLFSPSFAALHLRLTATGAALAGGAQLVAGVIAGFTWAGGNYSGAYENTGEGFSQTLLAVGPVSILALVGALVLFAGQMVFVYNIYRSITSGKAVPQEVLVDL